MPPSHRCAAAAPEMAAPEDSGLVPLRLLRVVAGVARAGGANRAAAALHLSPSAVSRALHRVEAAAGVPLFERGARGMTCTPAGEVLASRAQRAIDELMRAQSALGSLGGPRGGALARGATHGLLEALVAIAEGRSEAAAAARLGVSQPALHQSLQRLQHLARATLFERSPRGTRLSEAGEVLLRHAKLALAEWRIGLAEVAAFRGAAEGQVAVGALPMASDVLVPQALARLLADRRGVVATVADGTYDALLHQLRYGDLDLVVGPLRGVHAAPDVVEQALFVDRLVPVLRGGHPLLAKPPRRPGLRTLLKWPWIGPLPGTPAHAAFERTFTAEGLPVPAVAVQANSPAVVRSLLRCGDAIALLSPLQIRAEVDAGLLAVLPLALRGTERAIGVTLRRDGWPSSAAVAFLHHLRAVASEATSGPGVSRGHKRDAILTGGSASPVAAGPDRLRVIVPPAHPNPDACPRRLPSRPR